MKSKKIALAVISVLAMAFVFSCGSGCYTADGASGSCSYEVEPVAESSSSSIPSSSSAPCNLYGDWIEIAPANCDKKGVKIKICTSDPSITEIKETPQLSDCSNASSSSASPCGDWVEIVPATCDKKGVETRICTNGGQTNIEKQETEQLKWGEWVITKDAEGSTPAEGKRTCPNGDFEKGELMICGDKKFSPDVEFCQSPNVVKPFCGGERYEATQECCGNKKYALATQFCQVDTDEIKDLCGTETYTKNQFCDVRSSRSYIYKWVKIGEQVWMAENLKYVASGSRCGNGTTLSTADNPTCDTYGRLYDWITALALSSSCNTTSCASKITGKHRGICPEGWHIPSNAEWNTLINGDVDAGTKLKANSDSWNTNTGTDEFGFSALPGGYGNPSGSGSFVNFGNSGSWWSASEENASNAYYRYVLHNFSYVYSVGNTKTYLFSVRCVKD